jgi:uncharacterized protein YqfA (UPF0365 family)
VCRSKKRNLVVFRELPSRPVLAPPVRYQAYEILSIDIADVDVGRNIGAELQTDQA